MKTYWDALLRPARHRVSRWVWTIYMLGAVVVNALAAFFSATQGDRGMWWLLNAGCVALLILVWLFGMMPDWMREDAQARARLAPPTESIPIIPSGEATDPRVYAMMRAWETGEPMSIYRDDDGVWRDSDTDEVLPVQGEPDEGGRS